MNKPHPLNEAYFSKGSPQLFCGPDGRYMMGLAQLFGAHLCGPLGNTKDHDFVDNKCTACEVYRKPHRYLID
jgi:hypothetical protein